MIYKKHDLYIETRDILYKYIIERTPILCETNFSLLSQHLKISTRYLFRLIYLSLSLIFSII